MRAVVVYESMFGNTHTVAEAIGIGLRAAYDVTVTPVQDVVPQTLRGADLIVVGGPTHVHGMARKTTRKAAVDAARKDGALILDPSAKDPGIREWLASLEPLSADAVAFDTRVRAPAVLTGRASKGISSGLQDHGLHEVATPESFFVTKENRLEDGEVLRARQWGEALASRA